MLVITGTQRAGTTMMAKALHDSGYNLGEPWIDDVGGFEHIEVCELYSRILEDRNFPFNTIERTGISTLALTKKFLNLHHTHDAVKFSFLFMRPQFLDIWYNFRPPELGDVFLIMHRKAEHVIESKQRHAEIFENDSLLLQQSARTLGWHRVTCIAMAIRLGYSIIMIPFPEVVEMPLSYINARLAAAQVAISPYVWAPDPSKVHVKDSTT